MGIGRKRLVVQGQVQGVGFRPFVFTLAEEKKLTGFVRNSPEGVIIEVQGDPDALKAFTTDLATKLPPLARITDLRQEDLPPLAEEAEFLIRQSSEGDTHAVLISPDTATCPDCLAEIANPSDRRLLYPFSNCTNCGPRYTITRSIPYDRRHTSMACFPMCADCRAEYDNPRDRRFHAQPNACPVCGPKVWFATASQAMVGQRNSEGDEALHELAELLLDGGIAAVKGLGGFHLACDACNTDAVALLRTRKHRPHKPFAVMAASLEEARRFAVIGPEEETLLCSRERPIVLCRTVAEGNPLSEHISPDTRTVGVMLPYTPMHTVLFHHLSVLLREKGLYGDHPAVLVMTSGNPGGEPICLGNREAVDKLGRMADAFLFHDRDILIRVDDSVVRPVPGLLPLLYRRARGYVPRPIPFLPKREGSLPCVLGVGAELKNTLCLTKHADAFVSQHIGDMSNLETAVFHREIRGHLMDLLKVTPELVVRDLHPDYLASRMADDYAAEKNIPVLRLQHHFAHAYAVLAEHAFTGKALVVALDGTGLGEDGTLWGGEFLLVDTDSIDGPMHKRLGHLASMPLPGGETAIREPWRIAHGLLLQLDLVDSEDLPPLPWLPQHDKAAALLPAMLAKGINCPVSTGCGRLFDAASALLGLCDVITYEGQAAIRLEEAQVQSDSSGDSLYPCPSHTGNDGLTVLDTHALFRALYENMRRETPRGVLSRRFHNSLCAGVTSLATQLAHEHGIRHVGLTGGSMQNVTLLTQLTRGLRENGLIPLFHRDLPPGDACISLGQAAWGLRALVVGTPLNSQSPNH